MLHLYGDNLFFLLCTISFIINGPSLSHGINIDSKILNVGEELREETLPLQLGSRLYVFRGLKSHSRYEVKISYPASIPATFSLQLKRDDLGLELGKNRRLLNTEKLIFKVDSLDMISDQDGLSVLVSVEPEGIVAIPHLQEREFVTFNIVCEELLLGIPHKAWWVVVLVLLCLAVALLLPGYLPCHLLLKNENQQTCSQTVCKKS